MIFADFIRDEILDMDVHSCHPNHIMFFALCVHTDTNTHTQTTHSHSLVLYLAARVYIVSPWEH